MNNLSREKLIGLIQKNVKLFNMSMIERKDKPFILHEDFHISTPIQNNLFSWTYQFLASRIEPMSTIAMHTLPGNVVAMRN